MKLSRGMMKFLLSLWVVASCISAATILPPFFIIEKSTKINYDELKSKFLEHPERISEADLCLLLVRTIREKDVQLASQILDKGGLKIEPLIIDIAVHEFATEHVELMMKDPRFPIESLYKDSFNWKLPFSKCLIDLKTIPYKVMMNFQKEITESDIEAMTLSDIDILLHRCPADASTRPVLIESFVGKLPASPEYKAALRAFLVLPLLVEMPWKEIKGACKIRALMLKCRKGFPETAFLIASHQAHPIEARNKTFLLSKYPMKHFHFAIGPLFLMAQYFSLSSSMRVLLAFYLAYIPPLLRDHYMYPWLEYQISARDEPTHYYRQVVRARSFISVFIFTLTGLPILFWIINGLS